MIGALVVSVFAVPLFLGLDRWDMRNDEAIYSYAVRRMLDVGDWLTPLSIPTDSAFLEKPPLKLWLVAGGMASGLIPNTDAGMRVLDAAFGALLFAYVMLFAVRVSGFVGGAVALLTLFSYSGLLFDHGLRSNNMEGALVLSYAAGLFHALRWTELAGAPRARWHALAFAAFFALGFMTKFVAVAFLPLVVGAMWLLDRKSWLSLLARWREWVIPAIFFLAATTPWFIYSTIVHGRAFWDIILGEHVVKRFSSSLDPSHVAPWYAYFVFVWNDFRGGGSGPFVAAGLAFVLWQTIKGHPIGRLLVLWFALPLTLMSLGTSKVAHYAFPFVPPVAIAAGWAVAAAVRLVADPVAGWLAPISGVRAIASRPALVAALTTTAVALAGLAGWTIATGQPAIIDVEQTRLLSNSSIVRPALAAFLLLALAGQRRLLVQTALVMALCVVLPIDTYARHVRTTDTDDRPFRTALECLQELQRSGTPVSGMYLTDFRVVTHPAYYYFRHLGRFERGPRGWQEAVRRRVLEASGPALLTEVQWKEIRPSLLTDTGVNGHLSGTLRMVRMEPGLLLLLPGAMATCESRIVALGGEGASADLPSP